MEVKDDAGNLPGLRKRSQRNYVFFARGFCPSFIVFLSMYLCVCIYIYMYIYIYIYIYIHLFLSLSLYIYIYIYMFVHVSCTVCLSAHVCFFLFAGVRSVFTISNRKISNRASQILKANMLLMCPYCLKFQIARV